MSYMKQEWIDLPLHGIEVPHINYRGRCLVGAREANGLVFISGNACESTVDGHPLWVGAVGRELTLQEGYEAAQCCAMLHIGLMRQAYGLDRVESIVRGFGLICVADDFYELDKVFDGYSDAMYAAFHDRGRHVRTVMGTRNLPNHHVSIEVETIFKLKPV